MSQNEKEYVTLDYVAQEVGIKKGSLYYYLRELGIQTYKFPLNRHAHIAREDMELIQEAKESPWKINQLKQQRESRTEKDGSVRPWLAVRNLEPGKLRETHYQPTPPSPILL